MIDFTGEFTFIGYLPTFLPPGLIEHECFERVKAVPRQFAPVGQFGAQARQPLDSDFDSGFWIARKRIKPKYLLDRASIDAPVDTHGEAMREVKLAEQRLDPLALGRSRIEE